MTVKTRPAELAMMLTLDPVEQTIWDPQDLRAILRDQLRQPVALDLAPFEDAPTLDSDAAPDLAAAADAGIHTFDDLLHHPSPPLSLLKQTKHFAKLHSAHPGGLLPRDVATVLYFASIIAARRACDDDITGLDDHAVIRGIRWAKTQPWLDPRTHMLFEEGERLFAAWRT